MNSIALSIIEKLTTSYLRGLETKDQDSSLKRNKEDVHLAKYLAKDSVIFDQSPSELLYFSLIKEKEKSEILFEDKSALKQVNVPLEQSKKVANKQKQGKKKKNSKNHDKDVSQLIGGSLSYGYEQFSPPKQEEIYSLENMLRAIEYLVREKGKPLEDFKMLSLRRNLHLLMTIPISKQTTSFNLIYWNGLIFLSYDWKSSEKSKETRKENASDKRADNLRLLQYTGFAFERLITSSPASVSFDDNSITSFYSLVSHKVGEIPIHFTAEIDACKDITKDGLSNYIELKARAIPSGPKGRANSSFQRKLLSAYCQNKLIGSQNLVIGFRSPELKVSSIKRYETNELNGIINKEPVYFTENSTLNCSKMVKWYKLVISWITEHNQITTVDHDASVPLAYRLEFTLKDKVMESCLEINPVEEQDVQSLIKELIPPWFQKFMNENKNKKRNDYR
ncbi:hypothetical protein G9P44_006019 [Scheffersomyces stipitis]|nr:hypothetical protein G9P44_006019 [Scheffersomyces stipitis]